MYRDDPSSILVWISPSHLAPPPLSATSYLKRQPSLHLIRQHLRNTAIEVRQDLHRQLGLDATLADQVVEGVRERHADAT
jgi:hypothetical protein